MRVEPTLGHWAVADGIVDAVADQLRASIAASGALGLDVATLDERQRSVLDTLEGFVVEGGRVRPADVENPFVDHPFLAIARAGGYTPPAADGVDRAELRELVRRGLLVERDGVVFHADTIDDAGRCRRGAARRSPRRLHRRPVPRRNRSEPQVHTPARRRTRRPGDHPAARRSSDRRTAVAGPVRVRNCGAPRGNPWRRRPAVRPRASRHRWR